MAQAGGILFLLSTLFVAIALSISVFSPWYEIHSHIQIEIQKETHQHIPKNIPEITKEIQKELGEEISVKKIEQVLLFNWAGVIEHVKNGSSHGVSTSFQNWERNGMFHVKDVFYLCLGFLVATAVLTLFELLLAVTWLIRGTISRKLKLISIIISLVLLTSIFFTYGSFFGFPDALAQEKQKFLSCVSFMGKTAAGNIAWGPYGGWWSGVLAATFAVVSLFILVGTYPAAWQEYQVIQT